MTIRFTTTRAIGAAIALTISAGAASAQTPTTTPSTPSTPTTPSSTTTPSATDTTVRSDSSMRATTSPSGSMSTMQDSTRRTYTGSSNGTVAPTRVRKDTGSPSSPSSGMQVRKESSSGEVAPTPAPMTPAPTPAPAPMPEPTPAPAPAAPSVDSSAMTRDSSMTSTTTTTTSSTTVSSGEIDQPGPRVTRFGNGLYFGVQGGANFPQNEINSYYETGYGAGAQIGWDPANSPLGLRVNGMWNRLNGKDLLNQTVNGVRYNADLPNADLYSVFGDAKLRLPFGRFLGATSGLYAVGGGGVTYFRNYNNFTSTTGILPAQNSPVNAFNTEDKTQFALNGGGGLSFGVGAVSLFVEGRYVRVFTEGARTDYIPVTLGITFH
jgi:hypothetical protein